ncbi:DinB family protein [Paenibacillus beijingensis]|uniref:DinB-like domain-containing protein n=1 Tax=Paenibacillus beijingensis TaxID=1126833 RepID=A0A0D5NIG9_9BACL|nr:DinB family protein [Paenibacillus beijingensis]AJY74708.1 hypothetical protein VN24_09075 [Paenibacillus beijingensis]
MTNAGETITRFEEITDHYLQELEDFSMEQLTCKPSESEWSLGQVYVHLINSAMYMQLRNVELCRSGDRELTAAGGEKTEAGKAVFAQGAIPPIRIQVPPSPQYTPPQPEDKEQLALGLRAVVARMKELEPQLAAISPQHTVLHPGFGALNAVEWFQLVDMHYRHHLRQKERLKSELAIGNRQILT